MYNKDEIKTHPSIQSRMEASLGGIENEKHTYKEKRVKYKIGS